MANKKCPGCYSNNSSHAKFCGNCGKKIAENEKGVQLLQENKFSESSDKSNSNRTIRNFKVKIKPLSDSDKNIALFILFILIMSLLFVPTTTFTYLVEAPYQANEKYTEQEPYTAQEEYTIQVPYETQVPYERQESYTDTETFTDIVPSQKEVPYDSTEYYTDQTSGCETNSNCQCVDTSWWTGACTECSCSHTVTKVRTETAQESIQKTRPVTKYRTVTDYQTVTNYRTETKYRTVTKYRPVEKTRSVVKIRNETQSYEVNWLLGFRVPWQAHIP